MFLPLEYHLKVGERKTDAPFPVSSPPAGPGGGQGSRLETPGPGLRGKVPPGSGTSVPTGQGLWRAICLPPAASASFLFHDGKRGCPFPASGGVAEPQRLRQDTHFIFPFFNFKQKRHRGLKIKFLFPPPKPGPQPCLCRHPFLPAGTPEGGCGLSCWEGQGGGCAELGAGLFPNINTCVKTPGKSSPAHHTSSLLSLPVFGEVVGGCQAPASCGLLHPLIVEAMALRVPTDCRGSLKQLPGVGVHTPALPALPIHSHLALEREEKRSWKPPGSHPTFVPPSTRRLLSSALHTVPGLQGGTSLPYTCARGSC